MWGGGPRQEEFSFSCFCSGMAPSLGPSKDGVEAQEGNGQEVGEKKEPSPLLPPRQRLGLLMVSQLVPQEPEEAGILLSEQVDTGGLECRDVLDDPDRELELPASQCAVGALKPSVPLGLLSYEMTAEPPGV